MNLPVNSCFLDLPEQYLFSEVAARVERYRQAHPAAQILRLGIGDVTRPLAPAVIAALHQATEEQADAVTFRGYAPECGYDFLRNAIAASYAAYGVTVSAEEVFVSDGAKSDLGNLTELFARVPVQVQDPVYPVYADVNRLCGRTVYSLPATAENAFLPLPDDSLPTPALIYLCSPNNPTGAVYDRKRLQIWVDYADRTGSLLIFDAAYAAFLTGDFPHSIFEIPHARTCALEVNSFSKSAGFTGLRCGYTVIPAELTVQGMPLSRLWKRRQATRYNGVPYVVQRAAEAALSKDGMAQCRADLAYYRQNAQAIAAVLKQYGLSYTGGVCAPYLWFRCPHDMPSWDFFDLLLEKLQIVGTPGAGFGRAGEGYFRLSAFASAKSVAEAAERVRLYFG